MRLEQLKYFLSVANTHSMTKTGQEFFTTHQSISKALRQLEDEMGAPLFERSVKGMQLTTAGEHLYPVALECVQKLHRIQLDIKHLNRNQNLQGDLCLYGTFTSNTLILSDLLNDFNTLYPKIRYHIKEANNMDVLKKVALHKNLLGFIWMPRNDALCAEYKPYLSEVTLYPIYQDEYVGLISSNSPLATNDKISIDEFIQYPFALYTTDEQEGSSLAPLFKVIGEGRISFSAPNSKICLQAIASGRYVSICTQRTYNNLNPLTKTGLITLPFEEDLTLDLMLGINVRPQLDDVSRIFVELATEDIHTSI